MLNIRKLTMARLLPASALYIFMFESYNALTGGESSFMASSTKNQFSRLSSSSHRHQRNPAGTRLLTHTAKDRIELNPLLIHFPIRLSKESLPHQLLPPLLSFLNFEDANFTTSTCWYISTRKNASNKNHISIPSYQKPSHMANAVESLIPFCSSLCALCSLVFDS